MTLERRTPLRRGQPLKRGAALKRGGPIKPKRTPDRDRADDEWRFAVMARAGGRCEARTPACTGRAIHAHHRAGRIGDARHDVELGLAVCRECHEFIHHEVEIAYEEGWLVRRTGIA